MFLNTIDPIKKPTHSILTTLGTFERIQQRAKLTKECVSSQPYGSVFCLKQQRCTKRKESVTVKDLYL